MQNKEENKAEQSQNERSLIAGFPRDIVKRRKILNLPKEDSVKNTGFVSIDNK